MQGILRNKGRFVPCNTLTSQPRTTELATPNIESYVAVGQYETPPLNYFKTLKRNMNIRKFNFLLAFILLYCNSIFSQSWDILDKSMANYNQDGGTTTTRVWEVFQGGSAGSVITRQSTYVNFTKTNTGSSARWAWVRPSNALTNLTPRTAYSVEIKARVNRIDKTSFPDTNSYFEANQIALRLGSKSIAAPIFLKYGDGTTNGLISTSASGSNAYILNTSTWQIYRLVFNADHASYDVFIEGIEDPIFENVGVATTGDQNGIYFGAESYHRCNIDVEYVKMGTGDLFSKSKIVSVILNSSSQVENTETTITATATTVLIDDGETILFSLIDEDENIIVDEVAAVVSQDKAEAELIIPATVGIGKYFVQASVLNGKIGDYPVNPKKAEYLVCYTNKLPGWAFGGFVRPKDKNPVIEPDTTSVFFCPMNQAYVKWEESDTFNPAAVVKDDKICVLYRAEDNSATGIGKRVSRVALAETTDGVTMTRHSAPVLYPDYDMYSQSYEWPGGCEDPRVAVTASGTYVMFYTGWDRSTARLCVATSTDLLSWTKYGPMFGQAYNGKYINIWSKAASIVTKVENDKQIIAEMNVEYNGKQWTYFMYWGEACTYAAVSDDLVNWTPLEDKNGNLLILANTRRGYFDSSLVECGPPAVITDKGILMFYNGRNATNAYADPRFNKGTYSAGQMLFDLNDPCKLLARTDVPFFRPIESFEKSGQYVEGTVFIEGLVYYKKKWFLYYGCADSKVGVAIYDPENPADGDPVPAFEQGKGIAYYPPYGIGKKKALIHSSSGQTKATESSFNLLYSYLNPIKWCEDKNENPWVIFELNDYYNIEKTVFRDVAPYENGNGNVPEYWIYSSTTGTESSDWKELVHKSNQHNVNIKEDKFDVPEEVRYIKFIASRGTRTDNGNPENAIRIYGFDIYGSFSRPIDRGNIVSVGKTVLAFDGTSEYYCQPLHLLDGNITNQQNHWHFNKPGAEDSLKYVIIDLEESFQIEKFVLYDAGNFESASNNINGYNIYLSATQPDLSLISKTEDRNTVWTKVVEAKNRRDENKKTDVITPFEARYVKLEIPRSHINTAVRLYQFEIYKHDNNSSITQKESKEIEIIPSILKSGDNLTLKNFSSGELKIFNSQGILVASKNISADETVIPLHVPAGTYIVELKNNTVEKTAKLLVI